MVDLYKEAKIQRYSFKNMEKNALDEYTMFVKGDKGKPDAIKGDFVNILENTRDC